ncbi:hypothetical protein QOZ80_6AG0525490 [Eleusine coracana subsp. coracana]|nr:hypothetical protein QOZ80_6AG0525490 [Eleusine coracana subsp. coracana]
MTSHRRAAVALEVEEEPGGRLALLGHLLVHPHPPTGAAVQRPAAAARLHHELRPTAATNAGEPPVVHVPHDLDDRAVGEHDRPVAAEVPLDPARLHHLLPVHAHPHLPAVPAPPPRLFTTAARHRHLVLRPVVTEPAPRRVDHLLLMSLRRGRRERADLLAAAQQRAARGGGEPPAQLPRCLAAAKEKRELGVGDDGEVVVPDGLWGRRGGVLGLRRVPVDGHRRAGVGHEGPAAAFLLQVVLRRLHQRRRRPARRADRRGRRQRAGPVVDGHGQPGRRWCGSSSSGQGGAAYGEAPRPGDLDPELLAGRQRHAVRAGRRRLERPVQRGASPVARAAAAAATGAAQGDGAVAEAGEVAHCLAFAQQVSRLDQRREAKTTTPARTDREQPSRSKRRCVSVSCRSLSITDPQHHGRMALYEHRKNIPGIQRK